MTTQFISPQDPTAEYEMSWELFGRCHVQPLFSFKEEFITGYDDNTCLCIQPHQVAELRGYYRYQTCGGVGYRYNPALPADRLTEFWLKRGYVPESLDSLIYWEKRLVV